MSGVAGELSDWLERDDDGAAADPHPYFQSVAQARYVMRRVTRIVDELAKKMSLDPLEHQTLIQVFGAPERAIQVNDVAERLDIAPAFASRLVGALEKKGLVRRTRSVKDRRVTLVRITPEGVGLLVEIDRQVRMEVGYFQRHLSEKERAAALNIFAFYVGLRLSSSDLVAEHD